jgi:hypothetical protein
MKKGGNEMKIVYVAIVVSFPLSLSSSRTTKKHPKFLYRVKLLGDSPSILHRITAPRDSPHLL